MRGGYGVETAATDLAVAANGTPNMSVNVAAGRAFVPGTQNTVFQGGYECLNDATVNLTISAADPTNPRIDLVVAQVEDAAYTGVNNDWKLAIVQGTPASTPSVPTAPANSISLAQVRVNAGVTSITSGVITDVRPSLSTTALLTGQVVGAAGSLTGLSGSAARLVGAAAGSNPSSGTFNAADVLVDAGGFLRIALGGSPGTWLSTGATKLGTQVGDGVKTELDFNSINQSYTHLIFFVTGKTTATTAYNDFLGRFNGISTASYSENSIQWNPFSSTLAGANTSAQTSVPWFGAYSGTTQGESPFAVIFIPNYTSAIQKGGFVLQANTTSVVVNSNALVFRTFFANVSAAITAIAFIANGSHPQTTATQIDLYGLP